jgi:glucose/arabinose dehydrogenase
MCVELVAIEPQAGMLAFAALAVGDDGTLYAARPQAGQVWALAPGDDGLPAHPRLLIDGLTLPNALAFVDGALFVAAGDSLWRWRAGELTRLVDDLPSGPGFWTGGLASDGERLFVGVGAPCDSCPFDGQQRGIVLSFDMQGRDRQLVARGLRHPQALALHEGALWIGDSARYGLRGQTGLDELNRLPLPLLGQVADFGFPSCLADGRVDGEPQTDCSATLPPVYRLPTHSQPLALVTYHGAAFPHMEGDLLLILGGDLARPNPQGYQLVRIEEQPNSAIFHSLIPFDGAITAWPPPVTYDPGTGYYDYWANYLSTQRAGFYPHSPLGVAISPQGWIYVSQSGGRLLALRPID